MTRSSPAARRSQALTSPERGLLSRLLSEERNTENSHRDALAAAQIEHERVREAALRVYQLHELKEEHNRILEAERQEQERLAAEAAIVAEEQRLRELRAKTIPRPPPEPEPPKQPETPKEEEKPIKPQESPRKPAETAKPTEQQPAASILKPPTQPAPSPSPFAAPAPQPNEQQKGIFGQVNGPTVTKPAPVPTPTPAPAAPKQPTTQPPVINKTAEQYTRIHQELKTLRKNLVAESKVPGSPMKGKLGAFRREIRVSIGQLTAGRGANAQPVRPRFTSCQVRAILKCVTDKQNHRYSKTGPHRSGPKPSHQRGRVCGG